MAWHSRHTYCFLVVLAGCLSVQAQFGAAPGKEPGGPGCASTCHEEQCGQLGIRYGKFCGVGHGGCPGEKPCDSIDRCCKQHDDCVTESGILAANSCHKKFIKCLDKNAHKGDGFSKQCPYSMIVPAMKQGIQMAMMFTSMANGNGKGSQEL